MQRGFSLVELSIVLVILGLLVGGILAGQSLIRASQLRGVVTEHDRYKTAIFSFRDKYFMLPGDMNNATSFWGDQATGTYACASGSTPDGTPGTCNGNGNGQIGGTSSPGPEGVRAWQHLQLANLIEGSLTGYYDTGGKLTIGVNSPASKNPNTGWALVYRGTGANEPIYGTSVNFMQIGTESANELWGAALRPADAWNIDTKIDDGQPTTGIMLSGVGGGATVTCISPNGAAHNTLPAGQIYPLANNGLACFVFFKLQ